jgi:hypothetical protein
MLDGRGKVRITDFGLASFADDDRTGEIAGTPAYMAPEQLAGGTLTPQTDLFALGLVLYEIFTGRRAFEATSITDLLRQHEARAVVPPSQLVPDLDPTIDGAIQRCLEYDAPKRAASALAVAAALPGGDPLAAALAAGETPSPQMVAAAGEAEGLPVLTAIATGAAVLALVLSAAALGALSGLTDRIPVMKSPEVLVDRAQQLLQAVGYTETPADSKRGFSVDRDYLQYLRRPAATTLRSAAYTSRPAGLTFYYRTSPRQLVPVGSTNNVNSSNPPLNVSGMTLVTLDPQGRLLAFDAVPDQVEPTGTASAPSWAAMFHAAELDERRFSSTTPTRTPLNYADTRVAWTGELPDRPGVAVRVEAASYRGRPVYFDLVGPWSRPERQQERQRGSGESVVSTIVTITFVCLLIASALVARYNLRSNRSDRRAASRMASVLGSLTMAAWAVGATHVPTSQELARFFGAIGESLFVSALAFVLYAALEPWVRRFWPNSLKGWTRLVSGHVNDARVGRDVLLGAAAGTLVQLIGRLQAPLYSALGYDLPIATTGDVDYLEGMRAVLGSLASMSFDAAFNGMFCVFFVVAMKIALRRMGLAIAATSAFYILVNVPSALRANAHPGVDIALAAAGFVPLLIVTFRYGLLASGVGFFFAFALSATPWSVRLGDWRAGPSLLAAAVLIAVVAYATWAATARTTNGLPRPLQRH